ncbi:IS1634 family transposase, partial [Nostoc punctiforme UO1]
GEEGIPLFMQLGNGNELDQNAFPKMIKEFQSQWQGEQPEVYIMDAAFYTEDNLSQCSQSIDWISRVPLTIKSAQELIQTVSPEQLNKSIVYKGYSFCAVCNEYAEIKQQWIVVESEERKI